MPMDLIRLIAKQIRTLWPFATEMWQYWGIQGLVALSLGAQIFLSIFGLRRKYMTSVWIRFLIWAAYLFSTYIATIALGKLTVVQVDDPTIPDYHAELLGLLAPVLMIHLGNNNSLTAHSLEDIHLGFRQYVNIAATVSFVVWVLLRCWKVNSPVSKLYFPLFVAGLTAAIRWVWCLDSVYSDSPRVTEDDLAFDDPDEEKENSVTMILRAFHRFDCLKPHVADWLYHPGFVGHGLRKIKQNTPEAVFKTTEIELGFMYDVLYTKAPIIYTWLGIISQFLVVLSLASALSGFLAIYKSAFLVDMHVMYTYAILIVMLAHELYQTVLIPFSDWAVVKMIRLPRTWFTMRIICYLADICINQRRWSNTIGQLNLFEYCRKEGFSKPIGKFLQLFGKEEAVKRNLAHTRQAIPWYIMEKLHEYMKPLEEERGHQPFNKRGDWTFKVYNVTDNGDKTLSSSIEQGFDKSIITWHIATEICLNEEEKGSTRYKFVKMISDYMMYLVALRPHLLSLTTTDITMGYACEKIRGTRSRAMQDLSSDALLSIEIKNEAEETENVITNKAEEIKKTFITRDWDVILEARNLAMMLIDMPDQKWNVMSSIWVEMLCYGAYNCQVYRHAKMLRCGGELITHIWLILLHGTDNYKIMDTSPNKK